MLPAPLVGTYQQYKKDTDSIAAWLASTAILSGYPRNKLQGAGDSIPEKSGRLKGKARRDAKKAAESKPQTPYRIAIKEFITLSEYVAGKNLPVPSTFATTLDRLISDRGGFRTDLANHGVTTDNASDQKHSFFVVILERVREILRPLYCKPVKAAVEPKPTTPLEVTTNRFNTLTVHEPSDAILNASIIERPESIERPEQPRGDADSYEAEPLTALQDVLYAVWLMTEDLNKIRRRILWIWSSYKAGLLNLTTAAIATNTAVDLARSISEEVVPQTKAHGGMHNALLLVFEFQAILKGYELEGPTAKDFLQSDKFNNDLYFIGRDAFYWTYFQLYNVANDFKHDRGKFYVPEEDVLDQYDSQRDRATLLAYEKFEEDQKLVVALFNELFMAEHVEGYPIQDELMRGAKELSNTGEIPFYLVFGTQVFLDIHHLLRHEATSAFQTLQTNIDHMRNDVRNYMQIHNEMDTKNDDSIKGGTVYLRLVEYILVDPIYERKEDLYGAFKNMQRPATMERHRILRLSPVLSGLMLLTFRKLYRNIGLKLNSWGLITSAVHLQNALRNEGLLTGDWHDMKLLCSILPGASFFSGAAPTSPRQYTNHFEIQMGFSLANTAKNRHRDVVMMSKKGFRGNIHGHRIPLTSMFFDRYIDIHNRVDRTTKQLNEFIEFIAENLTRTETAGKVLSGKKASPVKHKKSKAGKAIGKKKSRSTEATEGLKIPPEQLIERLVFALDKEWPELAYPWIRLHCTSAEFLQHVQGKCKNDLRLYYGADLAEEISTTRNVHIAYLTGYIFLGASHGYMELVHRAVDAADDFQARSGSCVFEQQSACSSPSEVARLTEILEAPTSGSDSRA